MKCVGSIWIVPGTPTVDGNFGFVTEYFFGKKIVKWSIESLILGIVRFLKNKIEYALLMFEVIKNTKETLKNTFKMYSILVISFFSFQVTF